MAAALQEGRLFVRGHFWHFLYYVEGIYVKWIIFIHREGEVKVFRDKGFYVLYYLCNY